MGPVKIVIDGDMKSIIAKGKLIDKYQNTLREFKKAGLFKKSEKLTKGDKTIVNSDDKHLNDSYLWLSYNTEPFTSAVHHWNKTYSFRQNSSCTSIKDFLKEWPILHHTTAYTLVLIFLDC